MINSYEVEIKCLLGEKGEADKLLVRMKEKDSDLKQVSFHKQLNHYFMSGDLQELYRNIQEFIEGDKRDTLKLLVENARGFSLRTRQADKKVILVLKISVDEGTSANTVGRIEFEAETPRLTLEELDNLVLKSGFKYQAKWSRERAEYKFRGTNVTIDKNAGYGYLAEFERIIDDEIKVAETKSQLREMVGELELEELDQARLERMFAFYNANWQDYYGTDKVFTIE